MNKMSSSFVNWLQSEIDFRTLTTWASFTAVALIFSTAVNLVCFRSFILCLTLAVTYVGSLYIWRLEHGPATMKLTRDHDAIIKRRFFSVSITNIFSVLILILHKHLTDDKIPILESIGFRLTGIFQAAVIPLILTMILFAGPLFLQALDGIWFIYLDYRYWKSNFKNLIWLRNHVMAPLTEEFTFRACMIPILVPCLGMELSLITTPLFFGIAHFHHMMEKLRQGLSFKVVFFSSVFQFSYTTVFGYYSSFLFVRTGNFLAPFLVHSFCNHMGFPNFTELLAYHQPLRTILAITYIIGLVTWYYLLFPLTDPRLYWNTLWTEASL